MLAIGLVILLTSVQDTNARLRPYYVLRSATGDSQVKPRILFVLDSSGSMGMRAQAVLDECQWEECENPAFAGTDRESRMAAARRAINTVITATDDNAKYALMTFQQYGPHNPNGNAPAKCDVGGNMRRFAWIRWFNYPDIGFSWETITRMGYNGAFRLCQGNRIRPYPYLRWDNLGNGSVIGANDQAGAVPPSPLISTAFADMATAANADRGVQWFSEFMGVRFQPNDTTDPTHDITYATTGDYGTNNADKDANVFGHDFYYWPYVDGFPGYAVWETNPTYDGDDHSGIAGASWITPSGKLFAPFYFDFTGIPINPNNEGPASEQEARDMVIAHTSPLIEGGVDAVGLTPWRSTIGPIPAAPTQSNAIFAHTTVGSYLSFVSNVETPDVCAPTAAVLITDGDPFPATEGGWRLYQRLADLRNDLGAQVYVLGFFLSGSSALNDMACAGAGACDGNQCDTPCDDTPADGWDTCANSTDPANECAYLADSADELQQVLSQIVAQIGEFDVPSGPGTSANEFGVTTSGGEQLAAVQTSISAVTEYPSFRGHVIRETCDHVDVDDEDGDGDTTELIAACQAADFSPAELEETFGACPQSRTWDAGECLQLNDWRTRRMYTHDVNNQLVPVAELDGSASAGFLSELQALGLVGGADPQAEADEIVAFLLGRDAPDGWRLPGLASSAPITVRRIPPFEPDQTPSVAIRDPHCGGRLLGAADGVPSTLETYADAVWDPANLIANPSPHYEAQEAVVIGDDFGVLHAFQLNSGNELWGYIPRYLLTDLAEKAAVGPGTYGQTGELEEHNYGLSATINRGWVYDDTDADPNNHRWRQLAIIGMGPGGREYVVVDLSHMSPSSPDGPFEILWTTEDVGLKPIYDQYLGETWARPALGYHVDGDVSTNTPDAFFVMGSGYELDGGLEEGRTLLQIDALTGALIDYAVLPAVDPNGVYEPAYGAVVDPAAGTHCLSRLWAEMQEVYVADPAGRIFRWDLGRGQGHAADSGGVWGNAAQMALATPIPACEGAGDTCTVNPGNRAETFTFAPAITSDERLDDISSAATAGPIAPTDQFLVALVGGTPADDALRDGIGENYQSSLYILVDDHSGDASGGFTVPAGAPKALPGTDANYMRMALTDIERTRTFIPYEGAAQEIETRNFTRGTRPIRAPRIFVTGVVDEATVDDTNPTVIDGVEVYFIEFTVYEPPDAICDPRFHDAGNDQWHQDPGSAYQITFRLTTDVTSGFDLINGAGSGGGAPADFGAGYEAGLTLDSVQQLGTGDCANGGCGPQLTSPASAPCNNNTGGIVGGSGSRSAVTVSHSELAGFTPIE